MKRPLTAAAAALTGICVASAAVAQTCPPVADRSAEIAALQQQLKDVTTEGAAQPLTLALWQIWTMAPDATAQALLDKGMGQRRAFDLSGAQETFSELIAYCPEYAEGWNQRAFAAFLAESYEDALTDLDKALSLNPTHTGALSGKALTLIRMGRAELAQDVLREALSINPWLPERVYLNEAPGTDL